MQGLSPEQRMDIERMYERMVHKADSGTLPRLTTEAHSKLEEIEEDSLPATLNDSFRRLWALIQHARDDPQDELERRILVSAFEYFVDPWDLIPDIVPQEGLRDDAYVIDLASFHLKELQENIVFRFGQAELEHYAWRASVSGIAQEDEVEALESLLGGEENDFSSKQSAFVEVILEKIAMEASSGTECPDGDCLTCEKLQDVLVT